MKKSVVTLIVFLIPINLLLAADLFASKDDNLGQMYYMLFKDNGECYYFTFIVIDGKVTDKLLDFQYGRYKRSSTGYVLVIDEIKEDFVRFIDNKWLYGGLTFISVDKREFSNLIKTFIELGDKAKEIVKNRK